MSDYTLLAPANVNVSIGHGVHFTKPKQMHLADVYDYIRTPPKETSIKKIEQLREYVDQHIERLNELNALPERTEEEQVERRGIKDQIDSLKKGLMSFCWSGTFSTIEGAPKNTDLLQHSGRLQIDIDWKDKPRTESERLRDQLGKDKHIEVAFLSPTARGVKCALLIPPCSDDPAHKQAFATAKRYFEQEYNLDIDESCKDVRRICFFSHDPDLVLNPAAIPLQVSMEEEPQAALMTDIQQSPNEDLPDPSKPPHRYSAADADLVDFTIDDYREMLSCIPGFDDRDSWIRVGHALKAELGDDGYPLWEEWSAQSEKWKDEKDPKKRWDGFQPNNLSGATITHLAKQNGWSQSANQQFSSPAVTASLQSPWGEPSALQSFSNPYPIESLPPVLKEAVLEVAGFVQAPIPIVAAAALSSISTVVQSQYDVRRAEGLEGPTSLYLLSIADSGERKTASSKFRDSLREYEKAEQQRFQKERTKHEANLKTWEFRRKALEEQIKKALNNQHHSQAASTAEQQLKAHLLQEPQSPKYPRWSYEDATSEALMKGLSEWPAAGVESDEGGSFFGGYSMNSDNQMRSLSNYNKLWGGDTIYVDRRHSESYCLSGCRLTIGLQIQEATLREFLQKSGALARGSGFLARCLISHPSSLVGTRFFREPPSGWPKLTLFHERMKELLKKGPRLNVYEELSPEMLELSDDAKRFWIQFHNDIERDLAVGGEMQDVKDVASKTAENAVRLAANFHVFRGADGFCISVEDMIAGCQVALWHLRESLRFLVHADEAKRCDDAWRVEQWLIQYCQKKGVATISKRDLQRGSPVREGKRLEEALRFLKEHDRCRLIREKQSLLVELNPSLLDQQQGGGCSDAK